jgi:5-(carboxyamino)imidazole ribonucleotide synthase
MSSTFLPGSTIGVFGGGQLGRMLVLAAHKMGYRVAVYAPEDEGPASQVADWSITAPFEDIDQVEAFAARVDVVTMEFENVPVASLRHAARYCPVRPDPSVQEIAQHRIHEKTFLAQNSFPIAEYAAVGSRQELVDAGRCIGFPAVLKTAGFGYDGKGQHYVKDSGELEPSWQAIGCGPAVLESWIEHVMELSVVVARDVRGACAAYPPIENRHRDHILDLSLAPAAVKEGVAGEAIGQAVALAERIDLVGVMGVEFFLTVDGQLLINEIAPRPHNSGHLTIDASVSSQFEQQLRAVCGLPLGDPTLLQPAVMGNLLGDLWESGEPDWVAVADIAGVSIHIYQKRLAREGRKMGHLTVLHADRDEAERKVLAARSALQYDR